MSDSNRGGNAATGLIIAIIVLLFLAVVSSNERAQDAYRSHATSADKSQPVDQFATPKAGIPAIAEALVSNPEPEQSNDRERRDLAAQEGMAVWAFWMAVFAGITTVITSAGTILIWRQVKLTREAVVDTGKATEAMERQNDLAEIAQRPWLKIEARVSYIERTPNSFTVRCDVTATNVGKTVAQNCAIRTAFMWYDGTPRGDAQIRNTRVEAERAVLGNLPEGRQSYPLLPGESVTVSSQNRVVGKLKGEPSDSGEERLYYVVFAAARYQIPGQEIIRETDRAFCFTYAATEEDRNDPFQEFGIPLPLPKDISIETVWMRRAGHNRTT